jgi:hypothetical protein
VVWNLTSADPVGDPVAGYEDYADRTVQFYGTWGGATAQLQGKLSAAAGYEVLSDAQGNAISKTANALETVLEAVPFVRAALSAVGAGADVIAVLYVRKK